MDISCCRLFPVLTIRHACFLILSKTKAHYCLISCSRYLSYISLKGLKNISSCLHTCDKMAYFWDTSANHLQTPACACLVLFCPLRCRYSSSQDADCGSSWQSVFIDQNSRYKLAHVEQGHRPASTGPTARAHAGQATHIIPNSAAKIPTACLYCD